MDIRARLFVASAAAASALAAPLAAATGTFLDRTNATDLRVATWNVYNASIFTTRYTKFDRIADAVDADIWTFQEMYSHTAADTQALMNAVRPLDNATGWHVYQNGEHAIASKYPLMLGSSGPTPAGYRGIAQALVDLPDAHFSRDLYLMNVHYRCCGDTLNDPYRQMQSDAQVNWMRDARTSGGSINLVPNTAMAVLGDLNIVGGPQPLVTLLDGNIQNETTYGPDSAPDWDGSNNADAIPLHNNVGPETWTWRNDNEIYDPGRLDYVTWTDSVLSSPKRFVLNTVSMTAADRAATGLQTYDTSVDNVGEFYDHLPIIIDFAANAGQWGHDGDGSWSESAKWIGPVPAGANEKANFLGAASAPCTITLDSDVTIGALTMQNAHGYTIEPAGASKIILANSHQSFAPGIRAGGGGDHAIDADILWSRSSQVNVAAGTTLVLNGATIDQDVFPQTLDFRVSGTLNINGAQQRADSTQINVTGGGTVNFHSPLDSQTLPVTSLSASGAGTLVNLGPGNRLIHLRVENGAKAALMADGATVLRAQQLILGADLSGTFDLADNKMILSFQNPLSVHALIASGRDGGDWDGAPGITSSAARDNPLLTTVAVAPASDALGIDNLDSGDWQGISVRGNDVLLRYTWGGDADLDGDLDGDDYFCIDSNVAGSGSVFGYWNGDFDYDEDIDGDDYFIIDSNIAIAQSSPPLAGLATVPEPSTALLSLLALIPRRKKNPASLRRGG